MAEKSKVAETLDDFAETTHNLLDDNVRRFNREIPQLWLWDDHEVKNNWYPGMSLDADERYRQKDSRVSRRTRDRRFSIRRFESRRARPADLPIVPVWSAPRVFAIDLRITAAKHLEPVRRQRRRCTPVRGNSRG
jgi:hypothetical protein